MREAEEGEGKKFNFRSTWQEVNFLLPFPWALSPPPLRECTQKVPEAMPVPCRMSCMQWVLRKDWVNSLFSLMCLSTMGQ